MTGFAMGAFFRTAGWSEIARIAKKARCMHHSLVVWSEGACSRFGARKLASAGHRGWPRHDSRAV